MTASTSEAPFKRILVAVDGSEHGVQAARTAARLARTLAAHLAILTVYHNPSVELGEPNYSAALNEELQESEAIVSRAREAVLADGGPEPETEWLGGTPAETIIQFVKDADYDLVVVGSHGRGRMESALLGSVSHAVAAGAACPVMVIGPETT